MPRPRALSPAFALGLIVLLGGSAARAATPRMQIHAGTAQWDRGDCVVPVAVEHAMDPAFTHLLRRGVPVRLDVSVELWRARSGWFDKLVTAQAYASRVQYDLWRDRFVVHLPQGREVATQDSVIVERLVGGPVVVHLLRAADARAGARYYLVARATLSPLSADDLRELETWLLGSGGGEGVLSTGGYVGAFLRSVVGVEARTASWRGEQFVLPPAPVATGAP